MSRPSLQTAIPLLSIVIGLILTVCPIHASWADDPCEDSKRELRYLLSNPNYIDRLTTEFGEVRTAQQFQHATGQGMLFVWSYGAAGRVECAYLVYSDSGGHTRYFNVSGQHVAINDLDNDGIDEIIFVQSLPWGMNCSRAMAMNPARLQIRHLNQNSNELVDASRSYAGYTVAFLKQLKRNYDEYEQGFGLSQPECDEAWIDLIGETYENAWYWLLLGGTCVSFITFIMIMSKSKRWVWPARGLGVVTLVVTTSVAAFSVGDLAWHALGFCEFWTSIQILTGFRVHSLWVEIVSVLASLYAGAQLLASD